jgi:hypothetical protein
MSPMSDFPLRRNGAHAVTAVAAGDIIERFGKVSGGIVSVRRECTALYAYHGAPSVRCATIVGYNE